MLKLLANTGASLALLTFLVLMGDDCLHWYALPVSRGLHSGLFAGMIILSSLSCLLLLRSLMGIKRSWAKTILKLASASVEIETKMEAGLRYAVLSVVSALCFYISAVVWGVVYYSNGPIVGTGYVALSVFIAYDVTAVVAGVKLERIKRSMKPKRATARPGGPAA